MRFCDVCRSAVEESNKFCKGCGNQMPQQTSMNNPAAGYHAPYYSATNATTQNHPATNYSAPDYYVYGPGIKRKSGAITAIVVIAAVLGAFFIGIALFSVVRGINTPAADVPPPPPVAARESVDETSLVGTWYWRGSPYYVFEANGHGTAGGLNMRWSSSQGILFICNTPLLCGDNCFALAEWYYEISGDTLRLTSRVLSLLSFTYTRG